MNTSLVSGKPARRSGRPRRELAGEVEQRILDAARQVFLERGFEGASIDEIAKVARAGKPTIYARFPGKEALFAGVVERNVADNLRLEIYTITGTTIEERLTSLGAAILRNVLATRTVGLIRCTVAEARRFPDLAARVGRMSRERGDEAVAGLLSELARSGELSGLPSFAPDRLPATASVFLDLIVLPMLWRALVGTNLDELRVEIDGHVARGVAVFLGACRSGVP